MKKNAENINIIDVENSAFDLIILKRKLRGVLYMSKRTNKEYIFDVKII